MADRSAASIFQIVFEHLADDPTPKAKALALVLWHEMQGYDFSYDQLNCGEALGKLGLARRGIDPDYPEDGKTWLYGPE